MTNLPSNVYRGGNPADSDLSDSELSSVGFVSTRSPIETTQRPKVQSGPNGACASFFYRHKWFFLALAGLAIYFHIQIFLGLAFRQVFSYVIPFPPGVKDGHDLMLKMIPCMDEAFKKHNVTWFLDEGSVLGAIREQNIIKGDSDIDIGFLDFDRPKIPALLSSLKADCGFTVIHRDDTLGYPAVSSFTVRRNLFRLMMGYFGPPWFIDVRDYDVDTDGIVYDADFLDDSDTFFLPLSDIIPTVPCKFRDLTVPCPRNSEAVIVDEFGENWRTPIPGFKTYMIKRPTTAVLRERALAKARSKAAAAAAAASASAPAPVSAPKSAAAPPSTAASSSSSSSPSSSSRQSTKSSSPQRASASAQPHAVAATAAATGVEAVDSEALLASTITANEIAAAVGQAAPFGGNTGDF